MSEEKKQAMDGYDRMANKIHSLEAQLEEEKKEFHLTMIDCEREIDALVKERDLYNKKYLELETQNARLKEQLKNRLPMCPICGKEVALICPDDLKKLQDEGLRLEMLEGKMADGWCLVSPEDFERLKDDWKPEHRPHAYWDKIKNEWVDR
jgi:hypothetical protein